MKSGSSDKLPVLSGNEIVKILCKAGFAVVKQRGSHIKMKKIGGGKNLIVTVPNHSEVKRGILLNILKQAEFSREEFLEYVK